MITGSATQEKWLEEMGETAYGIAPDVDVVSFKGIFRLAIATALLEHHLDAWESLEHKDGEARRHFMESVLKHAADRIVKLGLSPQAIASIDKSLHQQLLEHIQKLVSAS